MKEPIRIPPEEVYRSVKAGYPLIPQGDSYQGPKP